MSAAALDVLPGRVTPGKNRAAAYGEPWFPKIRCGARDCGAIVAEVWCENDELHHVGFYPGFTLRNGIIELSGRALSQWERERRLRVPWKTFLTRGRRPNVPPPGSRVGPVWTATPLVVHGGGTFVFRCPVCRAHTLSRVDVPRECAPPGLCSFCPDLDA